MGASGATTRTPDVTVTRSSTGNESEALGRVQQAQLDPGDKVWSRLTLTLADPTSTPVATVYVFNRIARSATSTPAPSTGT